MQDEKLQDKPETFFFFFRLRLSFCTLMKNWWKLYC